ncbi:hypothetical protein ACFX14_022675 [Malus domestica]
MAIANLQAQMAILTSQLSQYIERTTIQSTPTFDVSYTQEYQADQHPQRSWESYHDHNQSMNNLFSNMYNSDWRDHSNTMWWEPQPVQHEGYWQPYNEFYSSPAQPPQPHTQYTQPNSGSSINYEQILNELNSLAQGSQNQAKEAQQGEYWQPYEEFYTTPMQPPQPAPQQFQSNSGSSIDCAQFLDVLTSLTQESQNQAQVMSELKNQMGEIAKFMGQMQEQSEVTDSTVEIIEAINLESGIEVGDEPKMSKPSQNMDEQLLLEEEEDNKATAKEEPPLLQPTLAPTPLPQPHMPSMQSTTTKVSPNSIRPDPVPLNVFIPCRIMQSKEEEGEKGIFETFPKNQEKEVDGECLECIKEDVLETTIPKEVEFYDMGQVPTITFNLAKSNIPETLKNVVFVIEFLSDKASKPSSPISILVYTNLLILMIQAPTLEFKPLPDHVKYHRPFKDQFHAMGPIQV